MHSFQPINRLKPCRHGLMLFNVHDLFVGRSLDLYGEWSEGELLLFRQFLKPGMIVVEAGANIGAHTVCLAKAVGPNGRVVAFEPQRIIFQILCANLAINSIINVDGRQAALGDAAGEMFVPPIDYGLAQNFGAVALSADASGEPATVMTLDSLRLPQCHLLKVDVEGMEQQVLAGAGETIARCGPILYVENERQDRSVELLRAIDALGYDSYRHCPPIFNPDNFARNPVDVFPNIVSLNILCCPRTANLGVTGLRRIEVP